MLGDRPAVPRRQVVDQRVQVLPGYYPACSHICVRAEHGRISRISRIRQISPATRGQLLSWQQPPLASYDPANVPDLGLTA
jgi:hypothetical protein